mgnify:CR=1 FL=1|tara:strand:+ start:79 stop:342 length:264 start_codon:yes stop_codon:yes gene_type:complete
MEKIIFIPTQSTLDNTSNIYEPGFMYPLKSLSERGIANSLYRKCYWYFIESDLCKTMKTLDELGKDKSEENIKLEQTLSVVYNHLSL